MDSRTRLLTAWSFQEPDRVPIEMVVYPAAEGLPGYDELHAFEQEEADNFRWVPGFDWGFFGIDQTYTEEVIEDVPGRYTRTRRTYHTPVGEFTSLIRRNADDTDPGDFIWEQHYLETVDDLRRLAEAPRDPRPFDLAAYNQGCAEIGSRGLPCTGLLHPLGLLVRSSALEEAYTWLVAEAALMRKLLESCTEQICASLLTLRGRQLDSPPVFMTNALEMLTPPWLGRAQFLQWVFPFDQAINTTVHQVGGRLRAHCHGNSGAFLELFADMGVDAIEPLEPPPYGDNDLRTAKRQVGGRMLLSGNIVSQAFHLSTFQPRDVRELVKRAIEAGAPGGGFTLHLTGGAVGYGKNPAQMAKELACGLELIDAWREFGNA